MIERASALRITGAARRFVDEPVPDAAVHQILDDARFAPSGGNRQPWRVAVVKDLAIRRRLATMMQPVWDAYVARARLGISPYNPVDDIEPEGVVHAPNELLDHIESVPVVLAIAADLGKIALMDGDLDRPALTGGASIYPFCWSIMLSARERGLGGVMTTFLSRVEPAAAPELRLPAHHALAATIFLGVPEHQATKLRRDDVHDFATIDRFDGDEFHPPAFAEPWRRRHDG
ncbi:MAG: nitroreductase family protein [Desertimonas sp.]